MPVNPLAILVPILVIWVALAYFLFRKRRAFCWLFIAASLIRLAVLYFNTDVERRLNEPMTYRLLEMGKGHYNAVEFTTSHGNKVMANFSELIARLSANPEGTVNVSMSAWYNFGKLHAYRIDTVDGISELHGIPPKN
jgi:hypothetical protein